MVFQDQNLGHDVAGMDIYPVDRGRRIRWLAAVGEESRMQSVVLKGGVCLHRIHTDLRADMM